LSEELVKPKLVDLSHDVEHGMITYKGLPGPKISTHMNREDSRTHYDAGAEFHIGKIEMVGNTGTYIDSPFHRYDDGTDLAQLPIDSVANLDGVVVHTAQTQTCAIDETHFEGLDLKGKAVLVHTGFDKHWRTDKYFEDNPFITRDAAEYLAASQAALVGIDSVNIDHMRDKTRPAHSILLRNNVLVVEHIRGLGELPDSGFRFFAVPVKIKSFGTFPVRAFALIE